MIRFIAFLLNLQSSIRCSISIEKEPQNQKINDVFEPKRLKIDEKFESIDTPSDSIESRRVATDESCASCVDAPSDSFESHRIADKSHASPIAAPSDKKHSSALNILFQLDEHDLKNDADYEENVPDADDEQEPSFDL